jgi:hypothetical protein
MKNAKLIGVGIIFLVFINFWSFRPIEEYYKHIELLITLGICFFFLFSHKKFHKQMHFKYYVLLFMLLPFLSVISCYFIHGQAIYLTVFALRLHFCWLFYFILHYIQMSVREILKIYIFIACVWVLLEVIQQFTYPIYYFYTRLRPGEEWVGIRGGIYRYMITGTFYAVFVLLYYLQNSYMSNKKKTNLFFLLFFLTGIYLNMTRQIMVAILFCLFITPFMVNMIKPAKKIRYVLGIICVLVLIYYFRNNLWGEELTETTTEQINDEDYVRFASFRFYLNYWDHWSCFIFGNGLYHKTSLYGKYMDYVEKDLGLFRWDVGIIGELSSYGIIYIVTYLLFCFYFFYKYRDIELYLKLYFIFTLMIVILVFPFRNGHEFIFFSTFLYLCDLSLNKRIIVHKILSQK